MWVIAFEAVSIASIFKCNYDHQYNKATNTVRQACLYTEITICSVVVLVFIMLKITGESDPVLWLMFLKKQIISAIILIALSYVIPKANKVIADYIETIIDGDARIKYKEFIKYYALVPAHWVLRPLSVRYYGNGVSNEFYFSPVDVIKYIIYIKRSQKDEKEKRDAENTRKQIEAWQKDLYYYAVKHDISL